MSTASERERADRLAMAIEPLLERLGARVVALGDRQPSDVVLEWDGEPSLAVRVESASATREPAGLEQLLQVVSADLGAPLRELSRPLKQRAVRILEERGAFTYRRSAEVIAEALGVSRFTVYNYLNRDRTG